METFDFESEEFKKRSKEWQGWIIKNHKEQITVERYTSAMQFIRKYTSSKNKPSSNYSPSKCKTQYKYLQTTFGFFV